MANEAKQTTAPVQKVVGATAGSLTGGTFAVIAMWLLGMLLTDFKLELPAEVETAFITIFTAFFTYLGGYYTPPGSSETVIMEGGNAVSAIKAP